LVLNFLTRSVLNGFSRSILGLYSNVASRKCDLIIQYAQQSVYRDVAYSTQVSVFHSFVFFCSLTNNLCKVGHETRMGKMKNAYSILVGNPEAKRSLGRPRHR
jgi:hypothetical protein